MSSGFLKGSCYFYSKTVNLHKQKNTKLSRQISHKNLDKSRVKFRSRVRVQQQRHMTETRNNYQDVHDVTQLQMSLTFLPLPNYREAEIRIHFN